MTSAVAPSPDPSVVAPSPEPSGLEPSPEPTPEVPPAPEPRYPEAEDPFGQLDRVAAAPGTVTVSGWAINPDTTGPVIVQMYLDRREHTLAWADLPLPDVGRAYPSAGPDHGYSLEMTASPGSHTACVYAINTGPGTHRLLGCRSVVVPDTSPFGQLERISTDAGKVTVRGWAIDPDTTGPVIVQMYLDRREHTLAWANLPRPDVGRAYPSAGPDHGYSLEMTASPGSHTACVYAINTGPGTHRLLGCRSVVVPDNSPFGQFERMTVASGRVTVSGWAIDPDAAGPVIVQMYVDRRDDAPDGLGGPVPPRRGAVYPAAGPDHGYSMSMDVSDGAHSICVFAINVGPGSRAEARLSRHRRTAVLRVRLPADRAERLLPDQREDHESGCRADAGARQYRLRGSSFPYAVPNASTRRGSSARSCTSSRARMRARSRGSTGFERYDPSASPTNQTYVRELRPTREGLPSWVYVAGPRQAAYLRSSGILITSGDFLRW